MDKIRLRALLAKIEDTYKTDSVPVVTDDGIQMEDRPEIEWGYLEENTREELSHLSFGRTGLSQPGGPFGHITVTVAIKGTALAYAEVVRPEFDVLMRMAAHSAVVDETVSSESVTYEPIQSSFESASVYAYTANSLFKLVGCRAILTNITILPAQIARATFDIWGVLTGITDIALPTVVYPYKTVKPPIVVAAGFTVDTFDPADFSSFIFEQRLQLPARPRGNDADGHAGYEPTDYDPRFVAIVDKIALASFNWFTLRREGTTFAWDIGVGSTQYNKMTISGPAARIVDAPFSDVEGFAMIDLTCRCEHTDEEATDAYTILFD